MGVMVPAPSTAVVSGIQRNRKDGIQSGFFQLGDCRAVTDVDLTGDQIRQIASHSHFSVKSRRAIVARDRPASYGIGRMFEIYREVSGGREQVRVFTSIRDAEEWLGLRKNSKAHSS